MSSWRVRFLFVLCTVCLLAAVISCDLIMAVVDQRGHGDEEPAYRISAGNSHSLIITEDGRIFTSGWNYYGQLGTGSRSDEHAPVEIKLPAVQAAAASSQHSLFLLEDGSLLAAGRNFNGQLGFGDTSSWEPDPEEVNVSDVQAISAFTQYSMIIKDDGTLWATGGNDSGQLGLGDKDNRSSFEMVKENVAAVAAGNRSTLIITEDGVLYGAGRNFSGELGLGDEDRGNRIEFEQVPGIKGAKAVDTGNHHTVVLKDDGTLWAMGSNNHGQLGLGDDISLQFTAKQVPEIEDVKTIAAGGDFTMLLTQDNTLWATGRNHRGQLGLGDKENRSAFEMVKEHVAAVAAGNNHTMIVTTDGVLKTSGKNNHGQLCLGHDENKSTFTKIDLPLQPLEFP